MIVFTYKYVDFVKLNTESIYNCCALVLSSFPLILDLLFKDLERKLSVKSAMDCFLARLLS